MSAQKDVLPDYVLLHAETHRQKTLGINDGEDDGVLDVSRHVVGDDDRFPSRYSVSVPDF